MRLKNYITEDTANTKMSDVNEILLGLYMVDGDWRKYSDTAYVQRQLEMRKNTISPEEYNEQELRSQVMAETVKKWMKANGYIGRIKEVWWTARPNVLSKAVGMQVDSKKNPTDVLVQTTEGKFLGLSAKSTKGKGDIGFKNPGIGTIDTALRTSLSKIEDDELSQLMSKHPNIPATKSARKKFVRQEGNEQYKLETEKHGDNVLNRIRNGLFDSLNAMTQEDLRKHVLTNWMDAEEVFPPYIKVTGHGVKGTHTADILNPLKNSHIDYLNGTIKLEKIGVNSIGVTGDGKRIMKMRIKYESEKLCSGIKLSGDPW